MARTMEQRKKSESYKRDLARKKMKRALNSLQKKVEKGLVENTQETQAYIASLKDSIANSYAIKKGELRGQYTDTLSRFQSVVQSVQQTIKAGEFRERRQIGPDNPAVVARKNKIFEREINQASIGGVSTLSKIEVKAFYAATEQFWNKKDITQRNKAILEGLGVSSLEDAFYIVLNHPEIKKRLDEAKQAQKPAESDADISNGKDDEKDNIGSPTWIQKLKTRARFFTFI